MFVTRKLSKEVTTLTIAKVIQRDHQKIRGVLQPVGRDIGNLSGSNVRSPPTIVFQFEYVISGGGAVMFWSAIIDDSSIRPFQIENSVKIGVIMRF